MRLETEGLEELLGDLKKVMELPDRVFNSLSRVSEYSFPVYNSTWT